MSLLAEGKKKAKYGLDPQNKQWSNDSNKFGQRLMERMGWEKGKGLGVNENGMTEHIKASYKWDQRGLGSTAKSADAWVAHQDDFNDLLKMLNSENQDQKPEEEEKDKASQVKDGHKRYYGRFSRGRVQTLRTTEDLDCIFGRRKSASAPVTPSNQSAANSGDEGSDQVKDVNAPGTEKSHGLTTVTSSTSVQEYFAKKMREMQAKKNRINPVGEETDGSGKTDKCKAMESPAPPVYGRVGFSYEDDERDKCEAGDVHKSRGDNAAETLSRGWYQNWSLGQKNEAVKEVEDHSKKAKKKKKKKDKKGKDGDGVNEISASKASAAPCDSLEHQVPSKKKRKKKKDREVEEDEETKIEAKTSPCESVEDEAESKNRKERAVEHIGDGAAEGNFGGEDEADSDRSSKKKEKKRKGDKENGEDVETRAHKKRKVTHEPDVLGNDEVAKHTKEDQEVMSEDVDGHISKKKRKNKEKEQPEMQSSLRHEEANANMSGSNVSCLVSLDEQSEPPEKKKKKKDKAPKEDPTAGYHEEREATEESADEDEESVCPYLSTKKKLRRKGSSQRSMFPGSNFEEIQGYAGIKGVLVPKSKKRKRKRKQKDRAEVEIKDKPKEVKIKERIIHKFMGGRDVNDKLREIARCQGGVSSSKRKSTSER